MSRFLGVRLIQACVTLLGASFVVFTLARVSGSPADLILPIEATPAERAAYIKESGLDRSIASQYWAFLRAAVRGDWGVSLRSRRPASELVFERLGSSVALGTAGLGVALVISVPLGVLAAVLRNTLGDRIAMVVAILGQAMPSFWAGILLVLLFSVTLGWFPTSGTGTWKHFVLPAVVIGWSISAGIVRLLRSSMLEVLDSEFVKVARSKGLSEATIVMKHALRNAVVPVITFVGFMYGVIIASVIVVEVVFAWPGLGLLAYESVLWRDYPVLQLTVLVWASLVILINLVVDVSYMVIDPRIRL
jgi:peptide/nickel transport system permease protein